MDLSVVIVNYNVRQFLENALQSIRKAAEGLEAEVFVVDNASTDGSPEMVRAGFPEVRLIVNTENLGFARANNIALARARGEFLLLINPDTLVQEDTFQRMIAFFRRHPDAGLAGCRILNPDGSFQLPCRRSFPTPWVAFTKVFGLAALFPQSRLFGRYNLTYLSPDATYPVDAVSGSFMMLRREVYEKIGGLDEAFFMYGEDLDWCFRVGEAGRKVYYVHDTQIVHFKGESTRRSDIDEVRQFYRAMQIFVRKHFRRSKLLLLFLSAGITLREALESVIRARTSLLQAAADGMIVTGAMMAGELIYFGHLFHFPRYAYPIVWTIPALTVIAVGTALGLYTRFRWSAARALSAVAAAYVLISATVFFAKDFAFSRAVVLISGMLGAILIPGWRSVARMLGRDRGQGSRGSLFGRRTVIVGTGPSAQEVLRRLRARVDHGYDLVGFVDVGRRRVGDRVGGLEVIGSLENIGRVVSEHRVGEVIFSTEGLSYADILSAIARTGARGVNFRLVPNSLEAIIGKTRIDDLDTLPLVDIDYNIHRPGHIVAKRAFDILLAALLLPLVWLPVRLFLASSTGRVAAAARLLPGVLAGELSFVGRPLRGPGSAQERPAPEGPDRSTLGPPGLTGLVQVNLRDDLEKDEIERYLVYYAKNQSLMLDLEILAKSLSRRSL
jgi:GT2 family glycosyltransferase